MPAHAPGASRPSAQTAAAMLKATANRFMQPPCRPGRMTRERIVRGFLRAARPVVKQPEPFGPERAPDLDARGSERRPPPRGVDPSAPSDHEESGGASSVLLAPAVGARRPARAVCAATRRLVAACRRRRSTALLPRRLPAGGTRAGPL